MKTYMKIIYLLGLLGVFASCDSNLDKLNPNSIPADSYYQTVTDLNYAVNAAYAVLQDQTLVGREWFFIHDLRSDDMASGGGQLETPRLQVLIGTDDASNFVTNSVFAGLYAIVHRTNAIVENGAKATIPPADQPLANRLIAEAKFLRAWAYFDLVSIWGGVPLYTEYVKTLSGYKARASVDDVYAFIIQNLNDAIATPLPASYSGNDIGRATLGAAQMLLARVYMQRGQTGDYASAKALLLSIQSSKQYKLVDNYNDNFLEETEYNAESVFEVGFKDSNASFSWAYNNGDGKGAETTVHNQEICPISWGNLVPSQKLLEEFESTDVAGNTKTDPRYKFSFYETGDTVAKGRIGIDAGLGWNIASSTVRGVTKKVGWRKHTILYKNCASYYPSGNNERIMRYAEALLMLAECQNETGDAESVVDSTLNLVRDRKSVSMPHYPTANFPTGTYAQRFAAIAHEKRVELGGEEIRNRDILRWRAQNKLQYIGGEPIQYVASNPNKKLVKLPQNTIDNNPLIGEANQNP